MADSYSLALFLWFSLPASTISGNCLDLELKLELKLESVAALASLRYDEAMTELIGGMCICCC